MGVGQTLVYKWECRLLVELMTKYYLSSEDSSTTEIFMHLADYFKGTLVKENETNSHNGKH